MPVSGPMQRMWASHIYKSPKTLVMPQLLCNSTAEEEVSWVGRAHMNPIPDSRRGMPMWKFLSRKRLLLQAMKILHRRRTEGQAKYLI